MCDSLDIFIAFFLRLILDSLAPQYIGKVI